MFLNKKLQRKNIELDNKLFALALIHAEIKETQKLIEESITLINKGYENRRNCKI